MNVLLINHHAIPELSGVANHFENISKNILSLNYNVTRLVAIDPHFVKKDKKIKYYTFVYDKKNPEQTEAEDEKRISTNYLNFERSLKEIDWSKIDFVITSNDIYLTILKKYISPEKLLSIIPSSLTFSKVSNPKNYLKVIKRLKKNAQGVHIIVLSEKMKRMLSSLLGKDYKIHVVPPGVDHARFSGKNAPIKNSLLYVGRIAKEKNLGALLTALKMTKTDCFLTIVGTGGQLKNVVTATKDNDLEKRIIFAGRQTKVERYYKQSSIFILPSKYEAFGLVIIEAMASGLPVIAFRPSKDFLTASDEIISDNIDGFLVKNEQEMAEKIDFLLKNKEVLEKMSKKALEKAKKFNWQDHVKKLLSFSKNN